MSTINPAAGTTNTVYGTSGNDNVHISKAPGFLGLLGLYEVNVNGNVQYMTKSQLEHTDFKLGDGSDTLAAMTRYSPQQLPTRHRQLQIDGMRAE